jgi:hypothetical protein
MVLVVDKNEEEKEKTDPKPDLFTKRTHHLRVFIYGHWFVIKLNEGQGFVHRRIQEKNSRETIPSQHLDMQPFSSRALIRTSFHSLLLIDLILLTKTNCYKIIITHAQLFTKDEIITKKI